MNTLFFIFFVNSYYRVDRNITKISTSSLSLMSNEMSKSMDFFPDRKFFTQTNCEFIYQHKGTTSNVFYLLNENFEIGKIAFYLSSVKIT